MLRRETLCVDWETHMKHRNTVRPACRFFSCYFRTLQGYINNYVNTQRNITEHKKKNDSSKHTNLRRNMRAHLPTCKARLP